MKILVVDDEPKIRELIGQYLTVAGYETEFAKDRTFGYSQWRKPKERYAPFFISTKNKKRVLQQSVKETCTV